METTDRMELPSLVLCALESAARVYHDRPVAFFMKGLTNISSQDDMNRIRQSFPTLSSFNNVYFFPLRMQDLFNNTPLHPWYMKIDHKILQPWQKKKYVPSSWSYQPLASSIDSTTSTAAFFANLSSL
ncbi:hypothetical protein FKM82_003962 [Ascaphus truei]